MSFYSLEQEEANITLIMNFDTVFSKLLKKYKFYLFFKNKHFGVELV